MPSMGAGCGEIKIDEKMQNFLFVQFYLDNHLGLESKIRPIKCLNIFSLLQKNPNKNILRILCATDCPVFEVKAKINASVPSDVIYRSKKIDKSANWFRLLDHSEATRLLDDITKNQPSNCWISWINAQMLSFQLSRENVLVQPGTAISISVRFGRLF